MCRKSWYDDESGGISPCGDEALVVENWAEDGEFVGFVVLPVYHEVLVQEVFELLHLIECVTFVTFAVLQMEWPLCVKECGPP